MFFDFRLSQVVLPNKSKVFFIRKDYVGAFYNKKLSFGSCKCSKGKPQDLFIKTCDFMNVTFIMRKNANIHHYEMYIIGQNIMAVEEIIILHIFSLPDLRYTKQINLK